MEGKGTTTVAGNFDSDGDENNGKWYGVNEIFDDDDGGVMNYSLVCEQ